MSKCVKCGKKGLFLKLTHKGYCKSCADAVKIAPPQQKTPPKIEPKEPEAPPAPPADTIDIPSTVDGHKIAYHYEDVKIFYCPDVTINLSTVELATQLELRSEPDNPHDSKAVALHEIGGRKIGYLFKGRLQDMANDYIKGGFPTRAYITSIDDDTGEMKIFLGFYKSKPAPSKTDFRKIFKLTANKNSDMQEMISLSSEGEEVTYDYDYDKEKYLASCGGEIGYFPNSANDFLEDNPDAFISEINENDNGKYIVSVGII